MNCPKCKAPLVYHDQDGDDSRNPLAECTQCDYTVARSQSVRQGARSISREFRRYHGTADPDQ